MAVDYVTVGISIVIFIFYLLTLLLLIEIRRRLKKEAGLAFVFIIIAILILIIRRLQQVFLESNPFSFIPYSFDTIILLFAIFFFIGVLLFYMSLKKAGSSRRSTGERFRDYKRNIGRRIR